MVFWNLSYMTTYSKSPFPLSQMFLIVTQDPHSCTMAGNLSSFYFSQQNEMDEINKPPK